MRGGGGITPDIFVPLDTNKYSKQIVEVLSSGTLTEAVSNYYIENQTQLKAIKNVDAFQLQFKNEKDLLQKWQQICTRDTVGIKAFSNAKDADILQWRAKAQLAKVLFGIPAFYQVTNIQDEEILKAIQVLNK